MNQKKETTMKNNSNSLKSTNSEIDDTYLFSASCQDATGLTPTIAHNEYEAASYEELYPYLPSVMPATFSSTKKVPAVDGIHAEMRKEVSPQTHKAPEKKNSQHKEF